MAPASLSDQLRLQHRARGEVPLALVVARGREGADREAVASEGAFFLDPAEWAVARGGADLFSGWDPDGAIA